MKNSLRHIFLLALFIQPVYVQAQWERAGLSEESIYALYHYNDTLLAGTNTTIYRSVNDGVSWDSIAILSSIAISAFEKVTDGILVSTERGCAGFCSPIPSIFKSSNDGSQWDPVLIAHYGANSIQKTSDRIYTNADGLLYQSTNDGEEWTTVAMDSAFRLELGYIGPLHSFGDTLFILGGPADLYRTTDFGNTWEPANNGLANEYYYSMVQYESLLYLGGGGATVYKSTDGGSSWVLTKDGLPSKYAASALTPTEIGLFCTVRDSVYVLPKNGSQWINVSTGLDLQAYSYIFELVVSQDNIFAATEDGIWRRPLSDVIASTDEYTSNELPEEFALYQNYPNPFNPETVIRFDLPVAGEVSVKVYDLLGREVAILAQGRMSAGPHQATWKVGNAPSGLYYYRLETGHLVATRKMILMK